jgi:hypothetical integral membrane protein (TIGR02206 family)
MLERLFSKFWFGLPFEIFNPPHLTALGLIAAACLLVYWGRQRFSRKNRDIIRTSLAVLLLLSQLSFVGWLFYIGEASISTVLPFHMCSLFIILSAIMLLARSYAIYEFSYFLGTGGAIFALLMPDIGMYNFPHFLPVQTMIAHGSLLTAQIYMTTVEGFRPTWRSLWKVYAGVLVYSALIMGFNIMTGANYLFFSYKPNFPTLLDYMGPWPWYIIGIQASGALTCLLLYLPFHWKDRRSRISGGLIR